MMGKKYSYAVKQITKQEVQYSNAHMFVQQHLTKAELDVIAAIMTQLSLKSGLKK